MLRHPSKKHNVARLRAFLNRFEKFDQKQFAELIDCSIHTLQSIETGRLKLSEELAHRIARETWVAVDWLLENNLKDRIVGQPGLAKRRDGKRSGLEVKPPYTFEYYEQAQASKIKRDEYEAEDLSAVYTSQIAPMLRAILFSAHKQCRLNVALWKVLKCLSDCRKQYGFDNRILLKHVSQRRERNHALAQ